MHLKNLGEIAGQISNIIANESYGFMEMEVMYAPRECGKIIHDGALKNINDTLKEFNVTHDEIIDELELRVDSKWLYNSGIESYIKDAKRFLTEH